MTSLLNCILRIRLCAFAAAALFWAACGHAADSAPAQALAAGDSPAAKRDWIDSLKNPVDWFEWGFDFRLRNEYVHNGAQIESDLEQNTTDGLRLRPRVWTSVHPSTNVSLNARLVSEPRYYFRPGSREGWSLEEGLFDLFNVRLEQVPGQPLTVTLGRQELAFGNRWLIWDGSTTDGTRTEFFDAARLTLEVEDARTTLDAIYISQAAETESWLPVINDHDRLITEQDEQAGVLYIRNRSLPKTQLDGFLIFRHQEAVSARGNQGDVWTAGARAEGPLAERWQYRLESAPQWGRLNGRDLRACGFNGRLTFLAGGSWQHQFRAGYEYLSGDDPATDANEGWDPFWARRAQWSELMVLKFAIENRGRAGDYKNLQRPNVGWSFQPAPPLTISADYMPLFANEPASSTASYGGGGYFRGHLLQAIARFKLNRHWSGHLWNEWFWPGDFYAPDQRELGVFVRAEINFVF
jgi:hypothetical protein